MRLDRDARRSQTPRLAKTAHDRIGGGSAAFGLKKPKRGFKNIVCGSPAESGKIRRHRSVFRGVSRLERFRHGTEVVPKAAALRSRDSQGGGRLQYVQAAQPGARRNAAEAPARPSRMETLVVMPRGNRLG